MVSALAAAGRGDDEPGAVTVVRPLPVPVGPTPVTVTAPVMDGCTLQRNLYVPGVAKAQLPLQGAGCPEPPPWGTPLQVGALGGLWNTTLCWSLPCGDPPGRY
jgi:hypothetical protein